MVFRSVGPVYYALKTGPTDPNITQGLRAFCTNLVKLIAFELFV